MVFFLMDVLSLFYFLGLNLRIKIEDCIYVQDLIFIKFNLKTSFYYMSLIKKAGNTDKHTEKIKIPYMGFGDFLFN